MSCKSLLIGGKNKLPDEISMKQNTAGSAALNNSLNEKKHLRK